MFACKVDADKPEPFWHILHSSSIHILISQIHLANVIDRKQGTQPNLTYDSKYITKSILIQEGSTSSKSDKGEIPLFSRFGQNIRNRFDRIMVLCMIRECMNLVFEKYVTHIFYHS